MAQDLGTFTQPWCSLKTKNNIKNFTRKRCWTLRDLKWAQDLTCKITTQEAETILNLSKDNRSVEFYQLMKMIPWREEAHWFKQPQMDGINQAFQKSQLMRFHPYMENLRVKPHTEVIWSGAQEFKLFNQNNLQENPCKWWEIKNNTLELRRTITITILMESKREKLTWSLRMEKLAFTKFKTTKLFKILTLNPQIKHMKKLWQIMETIQALSIKTQSSRHVRSKEKRNQWLIKSSMWEIPLCNNQALID